MPKQEGKGIMRGRGLVQTVPKVKREKKVKAIRITGKIEKPNEYVPFGRYGIHRFKLNDGILMLRTKSNNTIPSLAPQKVSLNIVDILKLIFRGKTVLTYNRPKPKPRKFQKPKPEYFFDFEVLN